MRLGGWYDTVVLHPVTILTRIGGLVAHGLHQAIDAGGDGRTKSGADEVNPKLGDEVAIDDSWAKGSGWVDGCTGDIDAW